MFGLNTYRKRKKLEIDREMLDYRESLMKEVEQLAFKCAQDKGYHEHEYHHNLELLGIEIAKLEARKETLANDVTTYKAWLEQKDKEIERLNNIVLKMAEAQKIIIQK